MTLKFIAALLAPALALPALPAQADYKDDIQRACLFRLKADNGQYVGIAENGHAVTWSKDSDGTQDFLIQPWFGPFAEGNNENSSVPHDNSLLYVTIANEKAQAFMSYNVGLYAYQGQDYIEDHVGWKWTQVFGMESVSRDSYKFQNREMKDATRDVFYAQFGGANVGNLGSSRILGERKYDDQLTFKVETTRCKNPPRSTGRQINGSTDEWLKSDDTYFYEGSTMPEKYEDIVSEEFVSFLRVNDPKARSRLDVLDQYENDPYYVLTHYVTITVNEYDPVPKDGRIVIKKEDMWGASHTQSEKVSESFGWTLGGEMGKLSGSVSSSTTRELQNSRTNFVQEKITRDLTKTNPYDQPATLLEFQITHKFELNRNDWVKSRKEFDTPPLWTDIYVESPYFKWMKPRPVAIIGVGTGVAFDN